MECWLYAFQTKLKHFQICAILTWEQSWPVSLGNNRAFSLTWEQSCLQSHLVTIIPVLLGNNFASVTSEQLRQCHLGKIVPVSLGSTVPVSVGSREQSPASNTGLQSAGIPDFWVVSTTILNPVDIFRRWCKLNFGLLWGHVKSHHITAILLKG